MTNDLSQSARQLPLSHISIREWELSAEDIVHCGKVVSALGETIRLMGEVDGVIEPASGWPVR